MGRKILFITTDQQRYDALGCNGNEIARTPVVDRLAADGINYRRAYNQNTVCMPARSTMLTGQYVRTHGVFANGVQLPHDAPSVAAHLAEHAGYRTALLGKAHFDPGFDPMFTFPENAHGRRGLDRPVARLRARRAGHARRRPSPGARSSTTASGSWKNHPDDVGGFAAAAPGRGRRRHRRARDEDQPDPARPVPHRLGRRPHDRVPRLARRRRRLVRVDELPRSAPPVGSARLRAQAGAVAGPRPPARAPRLARRDPGRARAEAAALARVLRGVVAQRRGRDRRGSCPPRSRTTSSARSTPSRT